MCIGIAFAVSHETSLKRIKVFSQAPANCLFFQNGTIDAVLDFFA